MVLLQSLEQGEALAVPDDILEQSTLTALTLAVLDELAEPLSLGSLPLPTPGGATLAASPTPRFGSWGQLVSLEPGRWRVPTSASDVEAASWEFAHLLVAALGLGPDCELEWRRLHQHRASLEGTGPTTAVFGQRHQGVVVREAELRIHLDTDGSLRGLASTLVPMVGERVQAQPEAHVQLAASLAESTAPGGADELHWLRAARDELRLVQRFVYTQDELGVDGLMVLADPFTGAWLKSGPLGMHASGTQIVHEYLGGGELPVNALEGGPAPRERRYDRALQCCGDLGTGCDCVGDTTDCDMACGGWQNGLAFDGAVEALNRWDTLFHQDHGWSSWNDDGDALRTFLRYELASAPAGHDLCARWVDNSMLPGSPGPENGTVVIGEAGVGDRKLHYHELTHGFLSKAAGLNYLVIDVPQVMVITEHVCDAFGALIAKNDTTPMWVLPEHTAAQDVCGSRSMEDPSESMDAGFQPRPQPDEMAWFRVDPNASYPHHNNGILNHMVYLLATGGSFNGVAVPSISYADIEAILFGASTGYLTLNTNMDGWRQHLAVTALWRDYAQGNYALPLTQAILSAGNAKGIWHPIGPLFPAVFRTNVAPAGVVIPGAAASPELFLFTRHQHVTKIEDMWALNVTRAAGDPTGLMNWSAPAKSDVLIRDSPAAVLDTATTAKVAISDRPQLAPAAPSSVGVFDYDVADSPGWPSPWTITEVPEGSGTAQTLMGPAIAKFGGKVFVFYVRHDSGGELYVWEEGTASAAPVLDGSGVPISGVKGQPFALVLEHRLWLFYPSGGTTEGGLTVGAGITFISSATPEQAQSWASPRLLETECGSEDLEPKVNVSFDKGATITGGSAYGYGYLAYRAEGQLMDDPPEGHPCIDQPPCPNPMSRGLAHIRLQAPTSPADEEFAEVACAVPQNLSAYGEYGPVTSAGPLVVYEGLTWAFFAEGEAIGRKWRGGP